MFVSRLKTSMVIAKPAGQHLQDGGRRGFAIDHDHKTMKFWGILCQHCNLAIGHALDSVVRLLSLAAYRVGQRLARFEGHVRKPLTERDVLRGLSQLEKDTITEGLQRIANGAAPANRTAAQSMLDQNMVDNFMWRSGNE